MDTACVSASKSDRWPEEVVCATFGAPFMGNKALADLVYENKWDHRLLHIVRRQDAVLRLLIAKAESECPPTTLCQQSCSHV